MSVAVAVNHPLMFSINALRVFPVVNTIEDSKLFFNGLNNVISVLRTLSTFHSNG